MRRRPEPAPVFVVGAPGAGTRLLALALAQHPGMAFLPGGWLGTLSTALASVWREAAPAARSGTAVPPARGDLDAFLARFGEAAADTLDALARQDASPSVPVIPRASPPDRGARWVDGEPGNALCAYGLSRLFPRARFIHLIRAPEPAVRSLAGSTVPRASYFTEASALEAWVRHVRASMEAERALGPQAVLRVRHDALVARPDAELRRCLSFLDEPFLPTCLRPLRGIAPDAPDRVGPAVDAPGEVRRLPSWPEAQELWRLLRSSEADGAPAGEAGRPDVLQRLARDFLARAPGGEGSSGPSSPLERLRAVVRAGVPEGATVLVVSRGDEELIRLPGRRGWHFPQTPDGVYAGHHPGSSAEAVAHLEELRGRGADYLLIPCTSFWWLEHYEELRRYLDARFRLVAFHEDLCVLFALGREATGGRARVAWSAAEGEGALAGAGGSVGLSGPPPR